MVILSGSFYLIQLSPLHTNSISRAISLSSMKLVRYPTNAISYIVLSDHFQFTLIHGPNIPDSYARLLFTTSDFTSITSHIHNWVLFSLWLHLFILSEVTFPFFSSGILGTYQPGEFTVQCPILLPFHTVNGALKARILVCYALLQWTTFCQNSPPWPFLLGWPYMAWLSFIELDKAVVHVISLVSFLWLWFSFCLPSDR